MVWATVSSWSCFFWLYRASPSLAAKNIINLISVVTIWWCPCVESSLLLLEEGVCYDQCIFLAKLLLVFALLHSIFQGQFCLLLQVFLDFLLLHSSPPAFILFISMPWKWKVKGKSLSHVRLFATPWTAAYQAPPSMGVSRPECWSGVPLPSLSLLVINA